ncbi:MAG: hypothetical protein ABL963_07465 [Longimicrobiales bacterium]
MVSLATIPSRIGSLGPVIDSIRHQTRRPDCVYVCICEFCEWEGRGYEVPPWLLEDPFVRVAVSPRDYGPANKLLGVLPWETAPTTRIVVVDDDWQCNPDLLEGLELRFRPDDRRAIGLSGAVLPRRWSRLDVRVGSEIESEPPLPWRLTFLAEPLEDTPVDLLQFGFGTVLRRDWFGDDIFELVDASRPWFFADDVLLSGYLASRRVDRICVAGMRLPRLLEHAKSKPLSGGGRMTERYRAAIPALASALDVWHPGDLAPAFPRKPALSDLLYWARLALRKSGQTLRRITRPPPRSPADPT